MIKAAETHMDQAAVLEQESILANRRELIKLLIDLAARPGDPSREDYKQFHVTALFLNIDVESAELMRKELGYWASDVKDEKAEEGEVIEISDGPVKQTEQLVELLSDFPRTMNRDRAMYELGLSLGKTISEIRAINNTLGGYERMIEKNHLFDEKRETF